MITSVDEALPMFCAGPADFLRDPVLEKPLLSPDGQHVLATDRKIVFRCAIADVTLPYADRPELCEIARLLAACIEEANLCATDGLADLPEIPPAVDCGACHGTGKTYRCPDCVDGEFWHGKHEYTCRTCDGTGVVDADLASRDDDALICDVCNGSGHRRNQPVEIGCAAISRRFLAAIAQLPGARIANPVTATAPVYFDSDLGDGCVMPLRD